MLPLASISTVKHDVSATASIGRYDKLDAQHYHCTGVAVAKRHVDA